MRISFIIPLYNKEDYITDCLNAILSEKAPGDQVIVVDNGSTDCSVEYVKNTREVMLLHLPDQPVGSVRNFGARHAGNDMLAFIDGDCVIQAGWRAAVERAFSRPGVCAAGAKVVMPENAGWIERAWFSQRKHGQRFAKYINSGNFVVDASVYREIGGFDSDIETGEDAEMGLRLLRKGCRILEDPGIRAVHLDNPKDLVSFYRKERWHSLGMLGTFRISLMDRPVIMTVAFICCAAASLVSGVVYNGSPVNSLLLSSLLLIAVPFATVCYRVLEFRNYRYAPHLLALYLIYYLARSTTLVQISTRRLFHLKKASP